MDPKDFAKLLADRLTRDEMDTLIETIEGHRDALQEALLFRAQTVFNGTHQLLLKFDHLLDTMKSGAA